MGQQSGVGGRGRNRGPQEGVYNGMDLTEQADWPGLPAKHVKTEWMTESQTHIGGRKGKGPTHQRKQHLQEEALLSDYTLEAGI